MAINVSTFSSNQSYRLTNAVLVYQDASRKPAFVSVHDVKTDGSKSGLLALRIDRSFRQVFRPVNPFARARDGDQCQYVFK
jgi:hypothetical protein